MSRTPTIEMLRLAQIEHPGYASVVAKGTEFMGRLGLSIPQFAERVGLGDSTMKVYMSGGYIGHAGIKTSKYIDARVWSYITRHWPQQEERPTEPLLDTQGSRKIVECVEEAIDPGAISLIYGPPSSEKSFVAEQITARYRDAGRHDLLYVICTPNFTPLALVKAVARAAEVWVRGAQYTQTYIDALVSDFRSRAKPPAIIVDEAQHLQPEAVETLRIGLHERTKRGAHKGCGIVLLGSHNLYSFYLHPSRRFRYEQLLSRMSYRVQLTGMTEEEVLQIGARALGTAGKKAKLTEAVRADLLKNCRVLDPYATDADGKPLRDAEGKPVVRTYYSSRRLLEYIRQKRRAAVSLVVAENIA